MIFKEILSVAMMSFIGKAVASCDFATKDGFSCCKKCDVVLVDDNGKWGVEDNQWCGIDSSCDKKDDSVNIYIHTYIFNYFFYLKKFFFHIMLYKRI